MTLLDSIIRATSAADSGDLSSSTTTIPIILNPNKILPALKPDSQSLSSHPAVHLSGWSISAADSNIIQSTAKFSKTLQKKLKNPQSLDRDKFLKLLNAFLQTIGENLGLILEPPGHQSFDFARRAVEKVGFFIGDEVAGLIVDVCLVMGFWELVETLIVHGIVGNLYSRKMVEKLVEQKQSRLLCLCVKYISDLCASELLALLRFFLSPSSDDDAYQSFFEVRKEWERQALLAIEKATSKSLPNKAAILAREASVLLMLAHDGFSGAELCLHYVFGSCNVDGMVFSSVISKLSGREVLGLIRYFGKWLKKYERFPEAVPCPQAKLVLGLSACDDIPSLDSVVTALGLILDEHFSYLVLNSEFHDEMRDLQEVVNYLASEADASGPVNGVVKHMKSQFMKEWNSVG